MPRTFLISLAVIKIAALVLWVAGHGRPAAVVVFFGIDFWLAYHLFVPRAQGVCRSVSRFETARPEIWLTIDDGPDPHDTPRILDLLERHHARATFFVIGQLAGKYPALIAEILRRGHDVAHHTHTHPTRSFWCAGPQRVRAELDAGLAALAKAGARPRWFRCPVGIKSLFLAAELEKRALRSADWSVRSHDTSSRDPSAVVTRVMAEVRPGSIVLMHEGALLHDTVRVRAIELLLEALTARNFSCVLPDEARLR
ncbi:MAG TPA: polysaccharide deacetylase family protein [Opitutaceae bacterium]|nr:polysaccharide deacetylase family protein [Opitutaceae bacterium]